MLPGMASAARFMGEASFPALGQPTLANTTLLLHLDGADGATTTTDASASPHTITFNNNAQLDTAFQKFGTASLLLDGNNDYLGSWTDNGFALGSGPFSVFAWVRPSLLGATVRSILHFGYPSARSWFFALNNSGAGDISCGWSNVGGSTSTGSIASANGIISLNTWQLVGVTRAPDATIRLFHGLDGAATCSVIATLNDATTAQTFFEGSPGTQAAHVGVIGGAINDYGGHIDELILTKECLATGAFLMPSAPFTLV